MKKIVALILAALMALTLTLSASAEAPTYKIGILAPETTHGWVGGVLYYAQQAVEELEGVEPTLLTSSNAEEMSSQIEQLVGLGVDAIVVWPQFTGVETAAEMALKEGIVIANFDMIINVAEEYADNMYQLTGDNYGMGYENARYIDEKLEGKGNVVILCKPAAGNVNDDRMKGFKDYLAEKAPDIEVIAEIASDFTREAGLKDMQDALTAYPQIDAVFSLDDETSIGVLQALAESQRTDVKIVTGGGGCQEYFNLMLDERFADVWVSSATYFPSMIVDTINLAMDVLAGNAPEEHLVVIPTTIVDRDNVADFLDANTPY